ncbi:hypothetical protein M0R45_012885 [Rubus argutus]|uniref:Histone deacetylase interacting domain-containing protein n=1 Tax=Rubus argutus TaxID=59490 RepID=A0AAW1XGS2_RUBAR
MVPLQHEKEYSAEPRMRKEMRAEEEKSSNALLLEKRCHKFLNLLRNSSIPWYIQFQNLMKDFKAENIDVASLRGKVQELLQGRPDLIAGFNAFLPEGYKITIASPPPPKSPLPREKIVCRKRKRDDDSDGGVDAEPKDSKIRKDTRFVNKAKEGDEATIPPPPSPPRVKEVLSGKREWDDDSTTGDDAGSIDSKLRKVIDFVNKVAKRFRKDNDEGGGDHNACQSTTEEYFNTFLDMISKRNKSSPITEEEEHQIYKLVATFLKGYPDLIDEFTHLLTTVPSLSSMIDFSNCKTCTPSYRLWPENFPIPAANRRSELASQVLNDRWVCVPSATSDDSGDVGHIILKSQHELNLLQCEEDAYEHDMLEESVHSASENIKVLLDKIKNVNRPSKIHIKKYLTEMNLRCIERLYGERGVEMIDVLRNDFQVALPVISNRLEQKKQELKQERSNLKKRWDRLYKRGVC